MEAMVSRRTEAYKQSNDRYHYEDYVSVWTEHGHWQMPYGLFEKVFGIKLAAWIERKLIHLPVRKAKALTTVR